VAPGRATAVTVTAGARRPRAYRSVTAASVTKLRGFKLIIRQWQLHSGLPMKLQ